MRIADAQKARGLAPLACKTDRIDCWVLAELARRSLVPEIWLPDPSVGAERERSRFRLHLVKHRSALKNRVHAILFQHGIPARTETCSALADGACSRASSCPSHGPRRCGQASY